MFAAPRFADRLAWSAVAAPVREQVAELLGAPIVDASARTGGFSPGFAGVVTTARGRSAFVKAIGTAQNPDTPAMLRAERDLNGAISADPHIPALLGCVEATVDGAQWVALVFEAVAGSSPPLPWDRGDAVVVLDQLVGLSGRLTPAPASVRPLTRLLAGMSDDWTAAAATGSPVVTGWVRERLPDLVELAHRAAEPDGPLHGSTLLHVDLRADNLVVDRSGPRPHVWFVDWPWGCAGPAWVDPALLALDFEAYGAHRPEDVLAEVGIVCPGDGLACLLAALAGTWADSLSRPASPGMGGIREFQRRFFDTTVAWLARRTGW